MFYLTIFILSFSFVSLALVTNRFPWIGVNQEKSISDTIFVLSACLIAGAIGWFSVEWVTEYLGFTYEVGAATRVAQVVNTIAILYAMFRGYAIWGLVSVFGVVLLLGHLAFNLVYLRLGFNRGFYALSCFN